MINLIIVFTVLVLLLHVYILPDYLLEYVLKGKNIQYKIESRSTFLFTFDDSPTPYTHVILDWLQENDLKAVFFVLADRIDGHEAILDRIVLDGHSIGNHGCKDRVHALLDSNVFEEELAESNRKLRRWIDQMPTKWFRPGSGFFNTKMLDLLDRDGYTMMLGNVHPFDLIVTNPDINAFYIKQKVTPGSIIVLHDNHLTLPTLQRLL